MQFNIDCSSSFGPLTPFWASTGFTPATLLLTDDMRQYINYLGSIPHQGIRFARIHFLMELVSVTFEMDEPVKVDWSRLDAGLDLLVKNGLAPIFELMGNPDGQFDDFNNIQQLARWRGLVRALALHLMDRYGKKSVEGWIFESWNEPDIGWWHQWPHDELSFCNYYDACAAGLEDANPNLVIGGPGTCVTLSSLLKTFLEHCDRGENCLVPGRKVRLDFISIHEKGMKAHLEDLNPRTQALLDREKRLVEYIRSRHPRLALLPFMNNECDPQVGWKDHHTWHALSYYAAWVCKSIEMHLAQMIDEMGVNYALLGNDHGFIGGWGNRTLLVRLGVENWIEDGQRGHVIRKDWSRKDFATPPFSLVKKPGFTAMTLLSLLGKERISVKQTELDPQWNEDERLGILATRTGDQYFAVLLYYSRDKIISCGKTRVNLRFFNGSPGQYILAHYRIDEDHRHPYQVWEEAGAPDIPGSGLLDAMRAVQEPQLIAAPAVINMNGLPFDLSFDLPLHGVSLLMISRKPDNQPSTVSGLRVEPYQGVDGQPEYLLRWNSLPDHTIQTYEVKRSDSNGWSFQRVNEQDLICSAYIVRQPGRYQVSARDYWGRVSEDSEIIEIKGF